MNPHGHDLLKEMNYGFTAAVALRMSKMELEAPDPFLPRLTWGKGKLPSCQLAWFLFVGISLYGEGFPYKIQPPSLYSAAPFCDDLTQNGGLYASTIRNQPALEAPVITYLMFKVEKIIIWILPYGLQKRCRMYCNKCGSHSRSS
ncbi:MAG: hypothetical protein SVY53_03580 [Chloroflexota bacterium]|nr:hypothetical protein [Chloroflexota bacterium]